MELTKEQIQKIENYLERKQLDYIDLKYEVLDHMVSDIESKIKQGLTFEEALLLTKQRWNPQLKDTFSYLLGVGYTAPKLVIQKAKKMYGKFVILLLGAYFLPFVILTELNFLVVQPSKTDFYPLIQGFMVMIFIFFTILLCYKTTQPKSTYGFILKTLKLNFLLGLLILLIILNDIKEMNGIHIGMYLSFTTSVFIYYHFFKKHKEVIKKYKIA